MKSKTVLVITLLLGGLFFCIPGVTADSENPSKAQIYCLKSDAPYGSHGPIYVDRNGDGKIDWEVDGPGMMAEMTSSFKMDTNFDGYYDVKYWIHIPITGQVKTWSTNIHERVPGIGKDFVRIKPPELGDLAGTAGSQSINKLPELGETRLKIIRMTQE